MDFNLHYLSFTLVVLSGLTFGELLINFKKESILKFFLCLNVLSIGLYNFVELFDFYSLIHRWMAILSKFFMLISVLNILTLLYDPKLIKHTRFFSAFIFLLVLARLSYETFITKAAYQYSQSEILFISNKSDGLNFLKLIVMLGYFSLSFKLIYGLLKKYFDNNVYFRGFKRWTISVGIVIILLTGFFIFSIFSGFNHFFIAKNIFLEFIFLYGLLLILFRPRFINSHFINLLTKKDFSQYNELDAASIDEINEVFYNKFYYLNPEASLVNLAKMTNISNEHLYNYFYLHYQMTFSDLVNKYRVQYFVSIVVLPQNANYTIDALAKMSGFTSRNHLYKPFRKFHGGIPSDFIDTIKHSS